MSFAKIRLERDLGAEG